MLPSRRRGRPIDLPALPPINWKATLVGLVRRLSGARPPVHPSLRACGKWPAAERVAPLPRKPTGGA